MHGQTLSTGRAWVFCSSCPDSPSPPPPQGTSGGVLWSISTQNRPSAGWVAVQPLWPSEELALTKLFSDAAFLVLGKTPPQSLVWLLCVPTITTATNTRPTWWLSPCRVSRACWSVSTEATIVHGLGQCVCAVAL